MTEKSQLKESFSLDAIFSVNSNSVYSNTDRNEISSGIPGLFWYLVFYPFWCNTGIQHCWFSCNHHGVRIRVSRACSTSIRPLLLQEAPVKNPTAFQHLRVLRQASLSLYLVSSCMPLLHLCLSVQRHSLGLWSEAVSQVWLLSLRDMEYTPRPAKIKVV